MSIPVYEACGHQIQLVTPSKAKHWRAKNPHIQPKLEGDWDQGLVLDACLWYIEIPYAVLADTLSRSHAPTQRRIHPWIDKAVVDAILAAGLAQPTEVDHHVQFTAHGIDVLHTTYAKLLRRDLANGFELVALLAGELHADLQQTAADPDPAPWTVFATQALQRLDNKRPGVGRYFRDMPWTLVQRLNEFAPYTAERLLRDSSS